MEVLKFECPDYQIIISTASKDKLLHVVVSATVTALLSHVIPFVGLLLVMTLIFVGKETYEKLSGKGSAEWKDIVADYVGFIIGII